MPAKKQEALGHGKIIWTGINSPISGFAQSRSSVVIAGDGIRGDKYQGMFRKTSGHDGDYALTDSVKAGTMVLNHRQITIVEWSEIEEAESQLSGQEIHDGWLRENLIVSYRPMNEEKTSFSQLPPSSRLVIENLDGVKVLILTEENGPCSKICVPIATALGDKHMHEAIKTALKGRRGQMAMVKTFNDLTVKPGDHFSVFPPMGMGA